MNLKSFGCSFIFGSELADIGSTKLYARGSQLTWPALLAKELGYGYRTYSRPGSGNLQIAERAMCELASTEPALYVIGWTWIDRFDYQDGKPTPWPGTPWSTILPVDDTELSRTYYRELHSDYRDKLTTLMTIRLTIDTLREKNLPFIMTYVDELMFDCKHNVSPAITALQDYIRPYMTTFEGLTFLDWSRNRGFPETEQWHPLEPAHAAAADYILQLGIHKV